MKLERSKRDALAEGAHELWLEAATASSRTCAVQLLVAAERCPSGACEPDPYCECVRQLLLAADVLFDVESDYDALPARLAFLAPWAPPRL